MSNSSPLIKNGSILLFNSPAWLLVTMKRKISWKLFYMNVKDCVQWSPGPQSEGIVSPLGFGFIQAYMCLPTTIDSIQNILELVSHLAYHFVNKSREKTFQKMQNLLYFTTDIWTRSALMGVYDLMSALFEIPATCRLALSTMTTQRWSTGPIIFLLCQTQRRVSSIIGYVHTNHDSIVIRIYDNDDDDDEMRAGGHQPPSRGGHILLAGWNRHPPSSSSSSTKITTAR